jgi:hypothetical protein
MGRRSLDATKVLWSLIVRAAVAFFRGACDFFAVDFFLAADEERAVLFLVVDDLLLCAELGEEVEDEVEVCADNLLPCSSSNSMARLDEVRRLRNIGRLSVTRLSARIRAAEVVN